ncbi:DUF2911 domain-containing protein [Ferruginibacter sp. SUN106]|uniref:DUF2911 domain-containing protein n=1 Tax=Ferruginibacter sp. SUN106 TaxID=2978348 RepID=UPI003D36AEDA
MKKILLIATVLFALNFADAQTLTTPQPSPTQTIKQNFGVGAIELNYSRPSVKGRKVMGDLVPFGKVWRTGANSATTLTFSEDVTIGGKAIKAGKYGLLTIPGEKTWTIIISKDVNVNQPSLYKVENDVVRVEADVVTMPYTIENFTINFANITGNSCNVELMWEHTYLQFPITTGTDANVMAQIDNAMNKDNKPYFNAASYYYDNGKDLNQALSWVNKALETNKDAFWMYLLKARIHKKLGDKTAAKAAALLCKDYATKAQNDDYVKMATELIAGL